MERYIPKNYVLSFLNHVREDKKIYFIDELLNGVFEYDTEKEIIEYLGHDMDNICRRSYVYIAKWRNIIALIPLYTKTGICLMDIEKDIEKRVNFTYKESVIHDVIQDGERVYLFTCNGTKTVYSFSFQNHEIRQVTEEGLWVTYPSLPQQYNNYVYCSGRSTSDIVRIDINNGSVNKYSIGSGIKLGPTTRVENNTLYYNAETDHSISFVPLDGLGANDKTILGNRIIINDKVNMDDYDDFIVDDQTIYLLPNKDCEVIKIDKRNNDILRLRYPVEFEWIHDDRYARGVRFQDSEITDNSIILYPRTGNGILIINKFNDEMTWKDLQFDMRKVIKERAKEIAVDQLSEPDIDLELFIDILKQTEE